MYPRVPDSISISSMSRCPDWSRTISVWSTHCRDLFKSKVSHNSNPARAAVATMGTTITRRSNDLNFEYSIVASHSLPEDVRTKLAEWLVAGTMHDAKPSVKVQRVSCDEPGTRTNPRDRKSTRL